MNQIINIGKPKKKSVAKLIFLLTFLLLVQIPFIYQYFQTEKLYYLSNPVVIFPLLCFILYKSWKNEHKHSRIKTDNETLYLLQGTSVAEYPFNKIKVWKIKKYFGVNIMTLSINQQKNWFFISGLLSSELKTLNNFINSFNQTNIIKS